MKKLIAPLVILLFFVGNANAQSNDFKTINIQVGAGVGAYGTLLDGSFDGNAFDQDTSAAAVVLVPIEGQFGLHKLISVGFFLRPGKYIDEDPNDPDITIQENGIMNYGVNFKFYPLNKDKFNLYLGAGFGATSLNQLKSQQFTALGLPVSNTTDLTWKGTSAYGELGFNAYFGERVGMFFDMRYDSHKLNLKDYLINGNAQDLTRWKFDMAAKGVFVNLGVSVKF